MTRKITMTAVLGFAMAALLGSMAGAANAEDYDCGAGVISEHAAFGGQHNMIGEVACEQAQLTVR